MNKNLDIEIGKLLGYTVYHYDKDVGERCYYMLMTPDFEPVADLWHEGQRKTEAEAWNDLPRFSSDGNAMLLLNDMLEELGWKITLVYRCGIYYVRLRKNGVETEAHTSGVMPEAVALAAYKVLAHKG